MILEQIENLFVFDLVKYFFCKGCIIKNMVKNKKNGVDILDNQIRDDFVSVNKKIEKNGLSNQAEDSTREFQFINKNEEYFFFKTEHRLKKVNFDDILYIEGLADYLQIFTKNEKILTLLNFKKMEEILPEDRFARVHKSFIIAIDKINSIEKGCTIIEKKLIPIGNSYRDSFFLKLKSLKLVQ